MEEYIIKEFSTVVCIIVHRNPHWEGKFGLESDQMVTIYTCWL